MKTVRIRIPVSLFVFLLVFMLLVAPVFALANFYHDVGVSGGVDAFIAYRDSTGYPSSLNTPKGRTWQGEFASFGAQSELPTSDSPVRWVKVEYSPIEARKSEKIVVTLSDDGYLDAYVWDGSSCTVSNNIGSCGTAANTYQCFDLAYEKTSGRALLVYSTGATTNEIGYNIWTYGSGWAGQSLLDLTYTTGIVNWISLAQCPGTRAGTGDDNEVAMIYIDSNIYVHGYVWTGSAWSLMGASAVWDATAAIATKECIAVAYEQLSGRAMFLWGDSVATDNYNRIWDGSTLSGPTLGPDISAQGGLTSWVTLKADPVSNNLFFLSVDAGSDLDTAYWSGSAWTIHTEHDATVDSIVARCADFAWEPTSGKGLLVWGTLTGSISYRTFTAPSTFGAVIPVAMVGGIHPWVQLRTNPVNVAGDIKILGAVLTGTIFDIGAIRWDGTTFMIIGSSIISESTTVITYECFELEFMNFQPEIVIYTTECITSTVTTETTSVTSTMTSVITSCSTTSRTDMTSTSTKCSTTSRTDVTSTSTKCSTISLTVVTSTSTLCSTMTSVTTSCSTTSRTDITSTQTTCSTTTSVTTSCSTTSRTDITSTLTSCSTTTSVTTSCSTTSITEVTSTDTSCSTTTSIITSCLTTSMTETSYDTLTETSTETTTTTTCSTTITIYSEKFVYKEGESSSSTTCMTLYITSTYTSFVDTSTISGTSTETSFISTFTVQTSTTVVGVIGGSRTGFIIVGVIVVALSLLGYVITRRR